MSKISNFFKKMQPHNPFSKSSLSKAVEAPEETKNKIDFSEIFGEEELKTLENAGKEIAKKGNPSTDKFVR